MRSALVTLGALAALALLGGSAAAHAYLVRANPAPDARLVRAPTEVRAVFTEPVDANGSDLAVLAADGTRVDRKDTRASDEAAGLVVTLARIGDGGYTVAWTARSAVDGHETKGAFAFAVGNAPLPALADVPQGSPPPSPLELAGRALSFIGTALLIGGGALAAMVRVPATVDERRRHDMLAIAGGGTLIAATALLLLAAGGGPQRYALVVALRGLAGAVAIGAALALRPRTSDEVTVAAGITAALSATLVSHAAASGSPLQSALDLAHVLAVSVWTGGVVALLWAVLPTAALRDEADGAKLGADVWRFSVVALAAVAALITTGTVQSFQRLVLLEDLFETPYGLALLAKIALLTVAVALGASNLLVWGPRLRRGYAALRSRAALARSVLAETALLGLALVATAILTALAPPATASGADVDLTQRIDGVRLELIVPKAQPGRTRFVLRVHEGLRPITDAQKVALRFTMVEHDMGENELIAEQRAPGEYVATGSTLAMFGTWKVQAIVRLPERDDVRTVFTVPVSAGGIVGTKTVSAGAYFIVAFTDPSEPAAGAPFTLTQVLVDSKGDPVTGKALTVTLQGPGGARELAASDEGSGRYVVRIDALDAGRWTVTVAIGSEAGGSFTIDVQR